MVEDGYKPGPVLSWTIFVSACVYAFIFVFIFNDYMSHVSMSEYITVSSVGSAAEPADTYILPQSSFVPHADGDILNVAP